MICKVSFAFGFAAGFLSLMVAIGAHNLVVRWFL